MRASAPLLVVLLVSPLACQGDDSGTAATATTSPAATMSTSSSTSSSTNDATESDATSEPGSTSDPGTTTTTTTGTTSGGDVDCAQDACLKCHQVSGEGGGLPFPICDNLRWDCDLPSPCGELALAFIEPGVYEAVDVDAAVCALEAMMGDKPARIALAQISDPGAALFVVGDGTAMIQWDTYGGDVVYAARSARLTLQDASYFEACLADPTPAKLGACLFGGNTLCDPEGSWTPPWSTGECSFAIPEGCAKG